MYRPHNVILTSVFTLAPIIVDRDDTVVHASPYHLKAATNIHEFPILAARLSEPSVTAKLFVY